MGKPSPEEMKTALAEAARLREQGEDDKCLGKALLSLNYRMGFLEDVLDKTDLYLHSGEGAQEHADLVKSIERAREALMSAGEGDDNIHPW